MTRIQKNQKGSVIVLVAVSLTLLLLVVAFVIDIGWIYLAKSDLKNASDAAALAGAPELVNYTDYATLNERIAAARAKCVEYSSYNKAGEINSVTLDLNTANAADGDIVVGHVDNPYTYPITFVPDTANVNAIKVKTQLTEIRNGPLALFWGGITGVDATNVKAYTTVIVSNQINGFYPPSDVNHTTSPDDTGGTTYNPGDSTGTGTDTLALFPFAVNIADWNETNNWTDQTIDGEVVSTFNLHQDITTPLLDENGDPVLDGDGKQIYTDVPGNFGTVDFLNSNGTIGASALKDIILNGVTAQELSDLGGLSLGQDADGLVTDGFVDSKPGEYTSLSQTLNSDTVKYDPDGNKKTYYIILYDIVTGPGGTAEYRIAGFQAIHIEEASLVSDPDSRYVTISKSEPTYTSWADLTQTESGEGLNLETVESNIYNMFVAG